MVDPPLPWGSPMTPLLPNWHVKQYGGVELPQVVRQAMTRQPQGREVQPRTVGELPLFWAFRSEPVSKEVRYSLARLAKNFRRPPGDHVVLPAGTDMARLLQCPLQTRTRNYITRLKRHSPPILEQPIVVWQLLEAKAFGIGSLIDLMCVTEAALDRGFLESEAEIQFPEPLDVSTIAWAATTALMNQLLRGSMESDGSVTLRDAIQSDLAQMADVLGITEELNRIRLSDLTNGRTVAEQALVALETFWQQQSPAARAVVEGRILAHRPSTPRAIADKIGFSTERIRQLRDQVENTLKPSGEIATKIAAVANVVRPGLSAITTESELERQIRTIFPSPTINATDASNAVNVANAANQSNSDDQPETDRVTDPVVTLAQSLLKKELGYICRDGICLNKTVANLVLDLRQAADAIQDDVGLVVETELRKYLTDDRWHEYWQTLVRLSGLHRINGRLATRKTDMARTKAALLSIGYPATKEDIAQLCGLSPKIVTACLSRISEVVRADKKRWGLKEWIEDEYKGISAEIIQRIEEDGGSTRLERLREELPRMFGVAASSVDTYAKTVRFQINDGYVSLSDPSSIVLRPLEDIMHGLTTDGLPYWKFTVESRYFRGYSLEGLPVEIAQALGCEPNGRLRVPILSPQGCKPVSVNWPLTSLTGATLGYLSDPLRHFNAQQGETIHLVLEACGNVSLRRAAHLPEATDTRPQKDDGSPARSTGLLEPTRPRTHGKHASKPPTRVKSARA